MRPRLRAFWKRFTSSPLDIEAEVRREAKLRRSEAASRGVSVEVWISGPLPRPRADVMFIRAAVAGLLAHAVAATPSGGRVEVSASPVEDQVEIRVSEGGAPGPELNAMRIVAEAQGGGLMATPLPAGRTLLSLRLPAV